MGNITEKELEGVFVDVRKAYRLLYHHQRRILDLVNFIKNQVGFPEFEANSWFSNNQPRPKNADASKWAWDWLNMYFMHFFLGTKEIEGDKVSFSVLILNDSGFYDNDNLEDRLKIDQFESVEESSSKLIFVAGKNIVLDKGYQKDIFNKPDVNIIINEDSKMMIKKSYNLSEFINEESTLNKINDFVNFCNNHNIEIQDKK